MKTTSLLAITILIVAAFGCTKKDNSVTANTQAENAPAEKSMSSATEPKPGQTLPNEIKAGDTTTPIEQDDSGKKVIFWYDPMLPDRHFSKSGQSPFMDMKLVPHYEVEANKGGTP